MALRSVTFDTGNYSSGDSITQNLYLSFCRSEMWDRRVRAMDGFWSSRWQRASA